MAAKNPKDCNDVDLEVMLFFNPRYPTHRHYVPTYNASFQMERIPYTVRAHCWQTQADREREGGQKV